MNKKIQIASWILTVLFLGISFIQPNSKVGEIGKERIEVEAKYQSLEKLLDNYIQKSLEAPIDQWLEFKDFPKDMVIYRYHANVLQNWVNLFPVSNDEVDLAPFWYRIHNMESRNLFNTPLAYLTKDIQYVNLGASWYVVKTAVQGETKILAGLLIKKEYFSDKLTPLNYVNDKLTLNRHYTVVHINEDDSNPVYSIDGEPLFAITHKNSLPPTSTSKSFRWLSILFFIIALTTYHRETKSYISLTIATIGLIITKFITIAISTNSSYLTPLFSAGLYADDGIANSLGSLLINNWLIFIFFINLFTVRKATIKKVLSTKKRWLRWLKSFSTPLLTIALIIYIHASLSSIILNSSLTLQPYKIENLNIYSILVYLSYTQLFIALILCIQLSTFPLKENRQFVKTNLFYFIYLIIVSAYVVFSVSYYGFKKEFDTAQVWGSKLAIERDISLELQLRMMEQSIIEDPLTPLLITLPHGDELILNRIIELYFLNAIKKYDLRLTICGNNDKLRTEEYNELVDCHHFFDYDIIQKYGRPISNESSFYHLNYFKNKISYIGRFRYISNNKLYNIYLEIDSKSEEKTIGYPSMLLNEDTNIEIDMPSYYSYAKYHKGKLNSVNGSYDYPSEYQSDNNKNYFYYNKNGYIHFVNRVSDENYIIISRSRRSPLPYIISFSYIMLFMTLIIITTFGFIYRKHRETKRHQKSLRRRLTSLITLSLIFALVCMSAGSIYIILSILNLTTDKHMNEKLLSVQEAITRIVRYSRHYNEINTREMYDAMDLVATNTGVDINLFDPLGRLIRSTKPDVFNNYVFSSRIDPDAYNQIINKNIRSIISPETIAGIKYHALYAPIYNNSGTLLAIINIPYFPNDINIQDYVSSIIATIINLYILFLLASVFIGNSITSSLTKPLEVIGKKMEEIDFSEKAEQIEYQGNDEISKLITAYNKMMSELEESTKKLAQAEREDAWREMARQIAHEIKNPLTPMRLSIQHLVRMKQQNYPNWQDKFDALSVSLLEQIDILTETANEFSSFARFYNEQNSKLDLVTLLREQKVFFDNRDNLRIELIENVSDAYVYLKKSQIIRALVNIISNAVQATENQITAQVRISVSEINNEYKIDIEDNGPGVSFANLEMLFKPNFTTKSSGTGLGLAITKNIIYQSQGTITYSKSEALGGANFTIVLPKTTVS